ncbi:AIPR family protein [Streptomyces sp. FL07-04A]|uniref:AIPR family protein n=1 Tax=Streptomyces sp. FL07-04A TaxID=3028658 RepID=UPI0029A72B67|nr:AIPR family protein [Streptomyces sp. FL07-04A]MDX3579230.1 AIPR family protein [Streptomyces sp. FL07-04A]
MNASALPDTMRYVRNHLTHFYRPWIDTADVAHRSGEERETVFLSRALAAQAVSMLTGCGPEEAAASVVDGPGDSGIDAIAFSKGGSDVWFVQAKWSHKGQARLREQDVAVLVTGLQRLADQRYEGFNSGIRASLNRINDALTSPRCRVHLVAALAGDARLTLEVERQLTAVGQGFGFADHIPVTVHTLGLADFHSAARTGAGLAPVSVSATLSDGWHRIDAPYEAYSTSVSADELASWYSTHADRLFDPALRSHSTGRPDPVALSRLIDRPEEFWYLTQGITVVCERIQQQFLARRAPGQPLLMRLDNARVVTGDTVIATVAQAVDQRPSTGSLALIPMRVICIGGAPEEFTSRLTQASEVEGSFEPRDLFALDPLQVALRDEFADELGKEYVYRRGAVAPAPDAGCTMQEAAVALACAHPDVSLVARASADPSYLWRPAPEGAYTRLFGGRPSARQVWQCVLLLRQVRTALAHAAAGGLRRGRDLAEHGDLLVAHLVLRQIDSDFLEELTESPVELEDWVTQRTWKIAELVASATENLFGAHLFLASVFTDERKSHVLAESVTRTLTPPPDALPRDVSQRRRLPNSVLTLVEHGRIPEGTRVMYRPSPTEERAIGEWLSEDPRRYLATWTNHPRRPLIWEIDHKAYSPSALVTHIWSEAAWGEAPSVVQGPSRWVIPGEGTLADLAREVAPPNEGVGI